MKLSDILPVMVGCLIAIIAYEMVVKKLISPSDSFEMDYA